MVEARGTSQRGSLVDVRLTLSVEAAGAPGPCGAGPVGTWMIHFGSTVFIDTCGCLQLASPDIPYLLTPLRSRLGLRMGLFWYERHYTIIMKFSEHIR